MPRPQDFPQEVIEFEQHRDQFVRRFNHRRLVDPGLLYTGSDRVASRPTLRSADEKLKAVD